MSVPQDGVRYPRDVPVELGMPAGWKGIEKQYGPTSKQAGKVYIRYFSLDGVHKNILGPRQVIQVDCSDKGLEPEPFIEEYVRLQKERHERENADRIKERAEAGILEGDAREQASARFRETYGALKGEMVFQFPGWKTKWEYMPNSKQVHVTYIEPGGREWKLLKDLESSLQYRMELGKLPDGDAMIRTGIEMADTEAFANGSKTARECGGVFEIQPGTGESSVLTQEERKQIMENRLEARKEEKQKKKKKYVSDSDYISCDLKVFNAAVSNNELLSRLQGFGLSKGEAESMAKSVEDISAYLSKRGFDDFKQLLIVLGKTKHPLLDICSGMYYRPLEEPFNGRPFFRQIKDSAEYRHGFVTCPHHVFWSEANCWKIGGPLKDENAGVARSSDDVASPVECKDWRAIMYGTESPGSQQAQPQGTSTAASAKSSSPATSSRTQKSKDDSADKADVPEASSSSGKRPRDSDVAEALSSSSKKAKEGAGVEEAHEHKAWSYDDCHNPDLVRFGSDIKEIPAHWPPGCEPKPGRWSPWLPKDWAECLTMKTNGEQGRVFVGPRGNFQWARNGVEKEVGHSLDKVDFPPEWPEWLPQDWGMSRKEVIQNRGLQLSNIFLMPGWESGIARYCENKAHVMRLVEGAIPKTQKSLRLLHPDNVAKGEKVADERDAEKVPKVDDKATTP